MGRLFERKVRRGIIYKRCSCCRRYCPESEFNQSVDHADKLQSYCKQCNKEYCHEWRQEHKR